MKAQPRRGQRDREKVGKEFLDALTGLRNRRYLLRHASEKLKDTQNKNIPLSILLIDLDYFKNVNDTFGHTRGDLVLREFGKFIKNLLREDDIVCRYGGDEFVCLLHNANYSQSISISHRFIQQCRSYEFAKVRLTMSIGIASSPEHAAEWQELFNIADRNLYTAKRTGRDRIGFFEKERKSLNIPTKDIIGRSDIIEEIKELIKPVFNDKGGVVCIAGEVGIGKTRLVKDILKRMSLQAFQFLGSNMSATTRSIPYYPFREIIRTVVEKEGIQSISKIPDGYRIEIIKILPELSEESRPINEDIRVVDKFRLFEGVRAFLESQYSKMPLFIFLDNIQWADEGTLELVHYLTKALKDSPVFFFFVYRIEEAKESQFQNILRLMAREGLCYQIKLSPLTDVNVSLMLSLILDSLPPKDLTEYICKETGGNPFFIEELMKSLIESDALVWEHREWQFKKEKRVAFPYSIEGVIDRKLNMISNEAQKALEYASVIGREFDFTFLLNSAKVDEGQLFDLLDEILGVGLLKEHGGEKYYFSEDLIREIIYRRLSKAKAKRYNKVIADNLLSIHGTNTKHAIEQLAHHCYLGGEYKKAFKFCMEAGDKAKEIYANREAIRFYTSAHDCLSRITVKEKELKEIECLKKRSEILNLIGENKEAQADQERTLALACKIGNRQEEAVCHMRLSKIFEDTARYTESESEVYKALAIYMDLKDKKGEARALHSLGNTHLYRGNFEKALKCFNKAMKVRKDTDDEDGLSATYNNLGIIHNNLGNYQKALEYYNLSLKYKKGKARKTPNYAITLNNMGIVYDSLGNHAMSMKHYHKALEINEEIGNIQGVAFNLGNIGIGYKMDGDIESSLTHYEKALKIYNDTGERSGEAAMLNNMGIIYHERGEYEKALKTYEKALKIRKEIGDKKGVSIAYDNLASINSEMGNYSEAMECYKQSLKIAQDIGDRMLEAECLSGIGDIYTDTGKLSKAGSYYKKAVALAEELQSKPLLSLVYIAITSFCLEKNDLTEAKKNLERTVTLAEEIDRIGRKADALLLSGRYHTKKKSFARAQTDLGKAYRIFEKLNCPYEKAKVDYHRGMLFKEKGEETKAANYLKKALKSFENLGAKGWIKIARDALPKIRKKAPAKRKSKK